MAECRRFRHPNRADVLAITPVEIGQLPIHRTTGFLVTARWSLGSLAPSQMRSSTPTCVRDAITSLDPLAAELDVAGRLPSYMVPELRVTCGQRVYVTLAPALTPISTAPRRLLTSAPRRRPRILGDHHCVVHRFPATTANCRDRRQPRRNTVAVHHGSRSCVSDHAGLLRGGATSILRHRATTG